MAFSIAFRSDKRLKMIDDQGMEEFEKTNALDASYLQLMDPNRDEKKTDPDVEEDEPAMNPMEAQDKFNSAGGELDVIIDLVKNLEEALYMDFRIFANKPRSVNALQDLAHESMSRFGRRRAVLQDVSARLKQGVSALKVSAARDNNYFQQVASLQRFWKIRLNPSIAEFADSPFSVDISLVEGAEMQALQEEDGATTGSRPSSAAGHLIPLVKDPSGNVCMRLDFLTPGVPEGQSNTSKAGTPQVAIGAIAVHKQLLALQQQLLWRMVGATLEQEARQGAPHSNFTYSLAEKVLAAVASPLASPRLSSLRALLLEHVTICRLPLGVITEPPRPYVTLMTSHALLSEIGAWLNHIFFRDNLYTSLDHQANTCKCVRLQWVPTSHVYVSALLICLTRDHHLLLVIQETSADVEGIPNPAGTLSRWAREGQLNIAKHEMTQLLFSLLQQAGLSD